MYIGASSALEGKVADFAEDINSIRKLFLIADYAHPWVATSAYTVDRCHVYSPIVNVLQSLLTSHSPIIL